MAPRLKVPRGPSTADKGKGQETIIVLETLVDTDLSEGNTTPNDTQAKQPTMEQYRQLLEETRLLWQQLTEQQRATSAL
jgi:hypothetical protein